MKRTLSSVISVLSFTSLLGLGIDSRVQAQSNCVHVQGRFEGVFGFTNPPGTPSTGAAEGDVTGDLAGTFSALYDDFVFHSNGAIALHGEHTLAVGVADPAEIDCDSQNCLFTDDAILLLPDPDPNKVRASSRLYIVGGTGLYEGATGLLHTGHGGVDFSQEENLSIGYKGQICLTL